MSRVALFLDRDGVINVDHGHVYRREDFEFVDGIFELVRAARAVGHLVIVVTNQAGIGRGLYSENEFLEITEWMKRRFEENDAHVDDVFYCPFHPEGIGQYRRDSEDRKPKPGMLLKAAIKWDVDLTKSILVGDKVSDIEAAQAAGVAVSFLYRPTDMSTHPRVVNHLSEVAGFLLARQL